MTKTAGIRSRHTLPDALPFGEVTLLLPLSMIRLLPTARARRRRPSRLDVHSFRWRRASTASRKPNGPRRPAEAVEAAGRGRAGSPQRIVCEEAVREGIDLREGDHGSS